MYKNLYLTVLIKILYFILFKISFNGHLQHKVLKMYPHVSLNVAVVT